MLLLYAERYVIFMRGILVTGLIISSSNSQIDQGPHTKWAGIAPSSNVFTDSMDYVA